MQKSKFMRLTLILGLTIAFISCQTTSKKEGKVQVGHSTEIDFFTQDSIHIYGDLYEVDKSAPTVLLFHQGGSNARAEYGPIIPRLTGIEFNVFAIDQRRGGQLYGSYNRTVADIPDNSFEYCDAYADIEGALNFVINAGFTGKKILWGSSYSATLAIKLANQHPYDVHAVLAFSPASGGPMQACRPDEYFATLKVPLLLLRPSQEMEIESVKDQFDLAQQNNHQVYVAINGKHGSSMLVEQRVSNSTDENWQVVQAFLADVVNN
jgi:pimeloyl-ACP methyl ester carboxylesterase